jgi:hypothetical protein
VTSTNTYFSINWT